MQHQLVSSPGCLDTRNHLLYTDNGDLFFLNSYVQNIYTILLSANTLTSTSQAYAQFFLAISVYMQNEGHRWPLRHSLYKCIVVAPRQYRRCGSCSIRFVPHFRQKKKKNNPACCLATGTRFSTATLYCEPV